MVEHNLVNNDNCSLAFPIALELSRLDDILNRYDPSRNK